MNDIGDRWEGCCLNGIPIGNGKIYNSNNKLVYRGFMYNNKKVCYGEEYYEDSNVVEYRGCFMNGLRHGCGCLYDRKENLLYEGNWIFDKNNDFTMNIPDNCDDDKMISCLLKELIIGENCYNNMEELIIHDFPYLERLEIGNNSFTSVEYFD